MQDLNLFSVFIYKLDENNIDYFITGSVASILYGEFRLTHHESGFKADVYLTGKNDFLLWGLKNKIEIEFLNREIFVAPPEYLIIKKLEFYKEGKSIKHLTDIQNMISISEAGINFSLIEKFVKTFGLETEWTEVKNKN